MLDTRSIVKRFHDENGKYVAGDDGWVYFKNGAAREADPMGQLVEPGDISKCERLCNQRAYYQIKLDRKLVRFEQMKDELEAYVANAQHNGFEIGITPKQAAAELAPIKTEVTSLKATIAGLDRQIAATPQGRAEVERERRQARARATAARQKLEIKSVLRTFRI